VWWCHTCLKGHLYQLKIMSRRFWFFSLKIYIIGINQLKEYTVQAQMIKVNIQYQNTRPKLSFKKIKCDMLRFFYKQFALTCWWLPLSGRSWIGKCDMFMQLASHDDTGYRYCMYFLVSLLVFLKHFLCHRLKIHYNLLCFLNVVSAYVFISKN